MHCKKYHTVQLLTAQPSCRRYITVANNYNRSNDNQMPVTVSYK